jgi:hypothetical protein
MEMDMKFNKIVKSLALTAGIAAVSFSSHADFLDFQIDETPYGGEVITADKLNGGYKEIINFDGDGNFTATAFASMNQLFGNEGGDNLGSASVIGANYSLYATFSASGSVQTPGVDGSISSLSADNGSFQLYIDPDRDTTAADADLSLSGTADDMLLGESVNLGQNVGLLYGFGGVFDFMFSDFELTEMGDSYFVSPAPFYMYVNVDGDFDTFPLEGEQRLTGDVSAVFVPEPSTLAVLGLGLLGLGATSRRKS